MNLLNGMSGRNAQWYYYSALANSGLGNNVIALQHAKEALRLDPDNIQYQMLVNRFERRNLYAAAAGSFTDHLPAIPVA